jgi:hypothetical protein
MGRHCLASSLGVHSVKGLLEVQEEDNSWQLCVFMVGDLLQVRKHVVADPATGQEASLGLGSMTSLSIDPSLDAMVRAASL